jgi:hypothetical protein
MAMTFFGGTPYTSLLTRNKADLSSFRGTQHTMLSEWSRASSTRRECGNEGGPWLREVALRHSSSQSYNQYTFNYEQPCSSPDKAFRFFAHHNSLGVRPTNAYFHIFLKLWLPLRTYWIVNDWLRRFFSMIHLMVLFTQYVKKMYFSNSPSVLTNTWWLTMEYCGFLSVFPSPTSLSLS